MVETFSPVPPGFKRSGVTIGVTGPSLLKSPDEIRAELAAGGLKQIEGPTPAEQREIEQLKDLAFQANHLAKSATGLARAGWYRMKNEAISGLLKRAAARVSAVELTFSDDVESTISISFHGGGKLHTRASLLDGEALDVVAQQLVKEPGLAKHAFRFVEHEVPRG